MFQHVTKHNFKTHLQHFAKPFVCGRPTVKKKNVHHRPLTTGHLIKKLPGFMETEGYSPH